ncbi:MAG: glycoside hydrolase family 140 protein, partial [Boseongicola sp.]|nr:glycoside hydrolase family 140 protein [Boseongicola sp.]
IWVLGGDTRIDESGWTLRKLAARVKRHIRQLLWGEDQSLIRAEIFREMAAGIKETEAFPHLMTFHPSGSRSSSDWFHNDSWLDFNMIQSGHYAYDIANYDEIAADYNRVPVKPVMDAENRYEDHAVDHNPEKGWFNDYDNRQAAYWGLFAGGHGHTYGNRGVWQMFEPEREPYRAVRDYWYDAMDLPGAWDMLHVRNLMLSRPMLSRVPDQSLVVAPLSGADHIRSTRADGYAFVYAATGRSFTLNLGKISGTTLVAWWFDPRTGSVAQIGKIRNSGTKLFDPPGTPGRGNDWVLVIDDAEKGFRAPGADL